MKNLIFLMVLFPLIINAQTNWQKGFNSGFEEGYCYNEVGCVSPPAPPSLPNVGDDYNSFQDGYNKGFAEGQKTKKNNASPVDRERYKTASPEYIDYVHKGPSPELIQLQNNALNTQMDYVNYIKKKLEELIYSYVFDINYKNYNDALATANEYIDFTTRRHPYNITLSKEDIAAGYQFKSEALFYLGQLNESLSYARKAQKTYSSRENKDWYEYVKKSSTKKPQKTNEPTQHYTSNELNTFYSKVNSLMQANNYSAAITEINNYINTYPKYVTYSMRGYCNFHLSNYSNAISDFDVAINEATSTFLPIADLIFARAQAKDSLGDSKGSIEDYDLLIELFKKGEKGQNDLATIYNNKAYAFTKLYNYNEALAIVNQALEINKNHWYIWDTKGEIQFYLENYSEAIASMSKAIEIEQHDNSYYYIGLSYIKAGNKVYGCQNLSKAETLGNSLAQYEKKIHNCE